MFIKLYAIALPVFFAIDMLWLGIIAQNFYRGQIGFLMKTDINWTAAITFYLLFIVGLVVFVEAGQGGFERLLATFLAHSRLQVACCLLDTATNPEKPSGILDRTKTIPVYL